MIRKLTIGAALLTTSVSAFASNWIIVDRGAEGLDTYIDTTSITHKGQTANVWEQVTLTPPRMDSPTDSQPSAVVKLHSAFNCSDNTAAVTSAIKYAANGSVISQNSTPTQYTDVVPDTVGAVVFRTVCGK